MFSLCFTRPRYNVVLFYRPSSILQPLFDTSFVSNFLVFFVDDTRFVLYYLLKLFDVKHDPVLFCTLCLEIACSEVTSSRYDVVSFFTPSSIFATIICDTICEAYGMVVHNVAYPRFIKSFYCRNLKL